VECVKISRCRRSGAATHLTPISRRLRAPRTIAGRTTSRATAPTSAVGVRVTTTSTAVRRLPRRGRAVDDLLSQWPSPTPARPPAGPGAGAPAARPTPDRSASSPAAQPAHHHPGEPQQELIPRGHALGAVDLPKPDDVDVRGDDEALGGAEQLGELLGGAVDGQEPADRVPGAPEGLRPEAARLGQRGRARSTPRPRPPGAGRPPRTRPRPRRSPGWSVEAPTHTNGVAAPRSFSRSRRKRVEAARPAHPGSRRPPREARRRPSSTPSTRTMSPMNARRLVSSSAKNDDDETSKQARRGLGLARAPASTRSRRRPPPPRS
jgi:hypothetical protein